MKKLLLLSLMTLLTQMNYASASIIKCESPEFSPREKWPKMILEFDQERKILKVSSTKLTLSLINKEKTFFIKSLELNNVDCNIPSLQRGIFWCKFNGYNRNGAPLTRGLVTFFGGESLEGIFSGNLQGIELKQTRVGLNSTLRESVFKEISLRLVKKDDFHRQDYRVRLDANSCKASIN